jgi:O-antigen/teichoic acid export membrane protein
MLVYSPVSLPLAVSLSVFFSFLTLISYLVLIRKNVPHYKMRLEFDVTIVKQFIRYSINIFLSKLSALFSTYLVRFILAYFLTPAAVTLYVVPNKLLGAVGGVLSSGANSLFPFISTLHARSDKPGIRKSFIKATGVFTGIAVPAFLFLSLFSKPVLTIWMGAEFAEKTWLLLSITSISSLIASASTIPNLVILGMGNSRLIAVFSVISIILYLIFLPWLTVQFGLIGSAAALLLNSVISIAVVFRYCFRYLQISFLFYFRKTYGVHVLPSVLLCGAGYCFQNLLTLPAVSVLAIGGGFLSLYYAFIYVVLLKNKEVSEEETKPLEVTEFVTGPVA